MKTLVSVLFVVFTVFTAHWSALSCFSQVNKPNILFLFADDQTFDTLGVLGHPIVKTPQLDRLCENGVTFSNAHNQGGWHGAICVASRCMINSGQFIWRARAALEGKHTETPPRDIPLWSERMKEAGYETYFLGKWHLEHLNHDVTSVFDHVQAYSPGGMPKPENLPEAYNRPIEGQPDPWSPSDPKFQGYWGNSGKHRSEIQAETAVDFINQAAKSDKPFFMYIAFNAPHDHRQSPQEFVDMYPVDQMDVPPNFLPEYPWKDEIGEDAEMRDEKLAPFPRTKYAVQVHRREYYGIISHLDAQIGKILDALEKTGQRDNTYIFYAADNGLAIGSHGIMGKQNLFEHSVKVPLIVVGPNIPKNIVTTTPVYFQDLMPTSLQIAGVPLDGIDFKSLLPLIQGESQEQYHAIYGCYVDLQRMVKKGNHKLILYPVAKKILLFNLENDPYEMNDLAEKPEYRELTQSLFSELLTLQKETGDELDLKPFFPEFYGN